MKYVEPIKSIILTLLVLLSILLTFMVWSYEPDYEFLEEPEAQHVTIGEETSIRDIIRPYKVIYNDGSVLHGSVSTTGIEQSMDILSTLQIGNVRLVKSDVSTESMNSLMNTDNQLMLFFNTAYPLELLNTSMNFKQQSEQSIEFDRLLIDESKLKDGQSVNVRFLNTKTNTVYRAIANVEEDVNVEKHVEGLLKNSFEYEAYNRANQLTLYLPRKDTDVIQFTYFIDEISQEVLTSALFADTSILQKSVEGNQEKYIDGMSLITFDISSKTMTYTNPAAESLVPEPAPKIVNDTFNFVNDHGGFTADFRLSSVNEQQKTTEYQLFFQGHPVYSTSTLTRIVTTWGDGRIFSYRRPYYMLDTDITTEKTIKQLPAGDQVLLDIDLLSEKPQVIDDVVIGYYLVQDKNTRLFVLYPSWFVISGNSWTRVTPQDVGGVNDGLE